MLEVYFINMVYTAQRLTANYDRTTMAPTLSSLLKKSITTTSFSLKIIAIIGMTMNHVGFIFGDYLPFLVQCIFIAAGGLTFPLMAFLLVEGYSYTSNVKKYALRLGIFALVSQVPYTLFLSNNGNVLFTLLIGLLLLYLYDHMTGRTAFWLVFFIGSTASLVCDWGFIGVIMIMSFRILRKQPYGRIFPVLIPLLAIGLPALSHLISGADLLYLPYVLYPLAGCSLTIPLIAAYAGKRGRSMKYFFYAYYPSHIAIAGLLFLALFGQMPLK